MQIKCFSKCPCFKKRPLPRKIHGYATACSRSFLAFSNRIELLKMLLKIQEFPVQVIVLTCSKFAKYFLYLTQLYLALLLKRISLVKSKQKTK